MKNEMFFFNCKGKLEKMRIERRGKAQNCKFPVPVNSEKNMHCYQRSMLGNYEAPYY